MFPPRTSAQRLRPARPSVEHLETRCLLDGGLSTTFHLDFGPQNSPVSPGYTPAGATLYTAALGRGWKSVSGVNWLVAADRGGSAPLTRDFVFGPDGTFLLDLANGTYEVKVTLGDVGSVRDNIAVWSQGQQVAVGLTTQAGQFLQKTFTAQVSDGRLSLRFADMGGVTPYFTLNALDVVPVLSTPPSAPVSGNPRLAWSPEQQAVWERMRRENHPWWQLIKDSADRTGTSNQRYGDYGQWATLAYRITGDTAYANKAWNQIASAALVPENRNWTREYFAEHVILYDWLRPALSPGQRTDFIIKLNTWADLALGKTVIPWGTRTADSDEAVGHYFGLALLDVATGPDNPRAGSFLNSTWTDETIVKPVGGLTATGSDWTTLRNAVRRFVDLAEGGEWIESSDYNLGTLKLLFMGAQAVRTATGTDYFPEVTRFASQAALAQLHALTPDLKAAHQWGDEEHARQLGLDRRVALLGMLAGINQNNPQVGPYLNQVVTELADKYGYRGWMTAEPYSRMFYFYNPYAARSDWRAALSRGYFRSGAGLLSFQDSTAANASAFFGHMPGRTYVDHEVSFFGDFQLYRKGEWAVTHPLGYSGTAITGEATNSMLIAGLSSMNQTRRTVAQAWSDREGWAYLAGTTSGQYYDQPYWEPPPTFLREWTRSLFYLPSADKASDTVVVFDRVNADNPAKLPKFDRYRSGDRNAITTAPALKQWVIHAPVAPTFTPGGFSWATAGGQQVRVSMLSGHAQTQRVYNEKDLWGNSYNFTAQEQKYQVRLAPVQEQPWDTFLNVVQVSDSGTLLKNSRVVSVGGEAEGALVQRAGQSDALVLFGARVQERILRQGYMVNWTAGAARSELFLLDLDPTKTWTVRADGGTVRPLTVSAEGLARLTVEGSGGHVLALSTS